MPEASGENSTACYWLQGLSELQRFARHSLGSRQCFHWSLNFPEIMESGGFHAFIGNPPFVGGKKITGAIGSDYRGFLVQNVAHGRKGHADLSAYFFLRVAGLMQADGMAGLLATNTIAQGDTREVGLDALVSAEIVIPRAISSAPWPGVAALEVAHVWLRKGKWNGPCVLDGRTVSGITAMLSEPGYVYGKPHRLQCNAEKSFIGSYVLGMGFVLTSDEAENLILRNPKNQDCLFPYLSGDDLNSRPDQSPSRWVINFFDWPLNRSAKGSWCGADEKLRKQWLRSGIVPADYSDPVAADYPDLLAIVEEKVKHERIRKKDNGDYALRYPLYLKWWIYADKRPALYAAISRMERVIVTCLVTSHLSFAFVELPKVFMHKLAVMPIDDYAGFGLLQCGIHEAWARTHSSTLAVALNYSPSDCFENFPLPELRVGLDAISKCYYEHRQSIMQSRNEGLTKTYNRFHDQQETAADIVELRRLQIELDQSVAVAYGWQDLNLGHGFRETKQGIRFSISEDARREVLDRLLALNHQLHAEEVAAVAAQAAIAPAKRSRKQKDAGGQATLDL